MSLRHWIIAIAFGLSFHPSPGVSQENVQRNPSAEQAQQNQKPEAPKPSFVTAIEGIEAAIREAISAQGEDARKAEAESIAADLAAQREMARWAGDMAIAAILSAVFTFLGLVLILFTLIYTKRAAGHAEKMVKPAQDAAKAAIDAVNVAQAGNVHTQKMAQLQTRAYLTVKDVTIERWGVPDWLRINFKLINAGQSPAYNVQVFHMAFTDDSRSLGKWHSSDPPNFTSFPLASAVVPQGEYGSGFAVAVSSGVCGDMIKQPEKEIVSVEAVIVYQTQFQLGTDEFSSELVLDITIPDFMAAKTGFERIETEDFPVSAFRSQWVDGAVKDWQKNWSRNLLNQHGQG